MTEGRKLLLAWSALALCCAGLFWVAFRLDLGTGEAAVSPEVSATALAGPTGARMCERNVTGALGRYAHVWAQGGDTAQRLGVEAGMLSQLEYQIMTGVLLRFEESMAATGGPYVVDDIEGVLPEVRRGCTQAG
jgi:hypothetical protein